MGAIRITDLGGPHGLRGLAADFDRAARAAPAETRKVVAKGVLNIKSDWRQRWSGSKYLPAVARSITYDTHLTPSGAWGEAGPEHGRRQANLAQFLENEYGSVHSAPKPGGAPALAAEKPRFEQAMQDLAVKTLGWS